VPTEHRSDGTIQPGANPRAPRLALESTILTHGVPRDAARPLADQLAQITTHNGAQPAFVGVINGQPVVGMTDDQLAQLLAEPSPPKLNTANLGLALHRKLTGSTTVAATVELAARAGVHVFATGGLGGVHPPLPPSPPIPPSPVSPNTSNNTHQHDPLTRLTHDISSDLYALARFPVAVVASGVKNILDVDATREHLETLGVPVVGYKCDHFPAFYLRQTKPPIALDARFDDPAELADYLAFELARARRGVVVVNPIDERHAIDPDQWQTWHDEAQRDITSRRIAGRDVTPAVLARVHELSNGKTLNANIALIEANTALGAQLAKHFNDSTQK